MAPPPSDGSTHAKMPFRKPSKKKHVDSSTPAHRRPSYSSLSFVANDAPPSQPAPPVTPLQLERQKQQPASSRTPKPASTSPAMLPPPSFPVNVAEPSKSPLILTSLHRPSVLQYARTHELLQKHGGMLKGKAATEFVADVRAYAKGKGLTDSVADECVKEAKAAVFSPAKKAVEKKVNSKRGAQDGTLTQPPVVPSKVLNGKAESTAGGSDDEKKLKKAKKRRKKRKRERKKEREKKERSPEEPDGNTAAREPKTDTSLPVQYVSSAVSEISKDKTASAQKKQKKQRKRKRGLSIGNNTYDKQGHHSAVMKDETSESHAAANAITSAKGKKKTKKLESTLHDDRKNPSDLPPKKKLKRVHKTQSSSQNRDAHKSRRETEVDKAHQRQSAGQRLEASAAQPSTLKRKRPSSPPGGVISTNPSFGKPHQSNRVTQPSPDIERADGSSRGRGKPNWKAGSGSEAEWSSTSVAQTESDRPVCTPSTELKDVSPADENATPLHDASVNIGEPNRKKARIQESMKEQDDSDSAAGSLLSAEPESLNSEIDDDDEATSAGSAPLRSELESGRHPKVGELPREDQSLEKRERKNIEAVELETTPPPSDSEAEDSEYEATNTKKGAASDSGSNRDTPEPETGSSDEESIKAHDDSQKEPKSKQTSLARLSDRSFYEFMESQSSPFIPSILQLLPSIQVKPPIKECLTKLQTLPQGDPESSSSSSESESDSESTSSSPSESDSDSGVGQPGRKASHSTKAPLRLGSHSVQQPSVLQSHTQEASSLSKMREVQEDTATPELGDHRVEQPGQPEVASEGSGRDISKTPELSSATPATNDPREDKKGKQRKLKGVRADSVSLFGTSSADLEGDEGLSRSTAEERWRQSAALSSNFNMQEERSPLTTRQSRRRIAHSPSVREDSSARAGKSTRQALAGGGQPFSGSIKRRSQKSATPLSRRPSSTQLPPPESPSESEGLGEKPVQPEMPLSSPVTRSQLRKKRSGSDASASPITSGSSRRDSNASIGDRPGLRSASTEDDSATGDTEPVAPPTSETRSIGRFVCVKILRKPRSARDDNILTYDIHGHDNEEHPSPDDGHRQEPPLEVSSDAGKSGRRAPDHEYDSAADMDEDGSVVDKATPPRPVYIASFSQVTDPANFGGVAHDVDDDYSDNNESDFDGLGDENGTSDAKGLEADDEQENEHGSPLRPMNEGDQTDAITVSTDSRSSDDDLQSEKVHVKGPVTSTPRRDTTSPKAPVQSTDRSRRGTSEDYPWISQEGRGASVRLTKPSSRRSQVPHVSQFAGTSAVRLSSTPPGAEIMEGQSDLGSRASSYDHEPKGFLHPDGNLSAQKRRTSLRSPHFAPAPHSQRSRRPPAGTVSSLPFPSVQASRFGLIQEDLAHEPFKFLVAVMFLNKTKGSCAIPKFRNFIAQYPTPDDLAHANVLDITAILRPLGMQNVRANILIEFAKRWLLDPPRPGRRHRSMNYPGKGLQKDIRPGEVLSDADPRVAAYEIAHLPGCGPYALDSWRIFCRDEFRGVALDYNGAGVGDEGFEPEWKRVRPKDKELRAFLRWMWLREGWAWDPETGERSLAKSEEVRAAEERWRWDQESGEGIWIDGGVDKNEGVTSGAARSGAALSPSLPARSEHHFRGSVESDEDDTDGVSSAVQPNGGLPEGDTSSQLAAAQLAREASLSQSRALTQVPATRPPPQSPFPTSVASVVGDGEATEKATDSEASTSTDDGDAISDSDSDRDGDNSSSYAPLAGITRMFRQWERRAKGYPTGEVEETPQPESPAKRMAGEAAEANPIENRSNDNSEDGDGGEDMDEMEGVEEGSSRQASPEL
ncbi:methyl-binding domain-containing protein 4 [Diplodia corticola]|uniref:Methyl-binding domain-containing protein 4 n=1 Tax=Diplodia corticola TaxID=236234 RepID=A0A1J9QRR6_9PEZI|nr:methyl-binding domain-containing protein 4 [Diplodia corticola]OJD31113.1 methyl-binding domain-containing protein 4 [Diplodia corticola]